MPLWKEKRLKSRGVMAAGLAVIYGLSQLGSNSKRTIDSSLMGSFPLKRG
jgi:hypothetical protein